MSALLGTLVVGASGGHDSNMAVGRRLVVAAGSHLLRCNAGDLCDRERSEHAQWFDGETLQPAATERVPLV